MGYVFLIPGFVFLGCFLVFPFFKSLVRSFTDWNAFSPDFSFVGLKNYIELFHNDEYWAAIKVNLVFAVVSTLIQTTLGFLLAFAVYYMTPKWQQFYKVLQFFPSAYCGNDGNKRHPFHFRRYEILCPVLYADRRWPRQGDDCSCTADLYYGVR